MYPTVGVVVHGVTLCDIAGEGSRVSNHNPRKSCCDLHLRWSCNCGNDNLIFHIC